MISEIKINNKEFINYIDKHEIKSALIGNGFSLSHPEYGSKFEFDINAIFKTIRGLKQDELKKILRNKYEPRCPETALKGLRYYYIQCVLEKYIKSITNEEGNFHSVYKQYIKNQHQCDKFLAKINNIFTTNYDPIIYFEMLKRSNSKNTGKDFQDGFHGSNFITQETILERLDSGNNKKIYYLHGSWFIQADYNTDDAKLRKCSFDEDSLDTIETIFNWEEDKLPYLIFEDSFKTKDRLIKKSCYLKSCLDKLEKIQDPILVFGMSFKMDNHIAEKLMKKELHVTYLEDTAKENLEKIFEKNNAVKYIQIPKDVVWDKVETQP